MDRGVVECMMNETLNKHYEGETIENVGVAVGTEDNATSVNDLVDNNSVHKVVTTNINKDDSGIVTKTTERRGGGQ